MTRAVSEGKSREVRYMFTYIARCTPPVKNTLQCQLLCSCDPGCGSGLCLLCDGLPQAGRLPGGQCIEHTKDRRQHRKREPASHKRTGQPTESHTDERVQVGRA